MYSRLILCLKLIWRETVKKIINKIKKYKYEKYWKEHKVFKGYKDKDKVFYIVRRRKEYVGLFSNFIVFVNSVKKAIECGYIPIIDMKSNFNIYLKENEVGYINSWETFFEQPMGYTLDDIKHSRNIIVGSGDPSDIFPYNDVDWMMNSEGEISAYKEIVHKYFHYSKHAQEEIENGFNALINENDKVLGVLLRGTDYTHTKPSGHPVQPTIDQMFQKIDEIVMKYNCNKIFIGTEDKNIYMAFVNRYNEKVITNRKDFLEYNGEALIGKLIENSVEDVRKEGMVYLVTIAILSKCDCFIGSGCSGTSAVMLLEEGFEYKYIFDLGVYK